MTYHEAIEEFDSKNDRDRSVLIFALFGRAMFRAQVIEQQAVNMLAIHKIFKDRPVTDEEYNAIWDSFDFSKNTLGKKAEDIKYVYSLKEVDFVDFKEVVSLRNHLTHNYFRFNDNLFFSEVGQKRMIKDFIDFIEKSLAVDKMLVRYTHKYNQMAGLTEERINELILAAKSKWSNKDIDETYDSGARNNFYA